YAEALVATAVFLAGPRRPLPLGASGVGRLIPLKRRLHMILSDAMTLSIARTAPRAVMVLGVLSLPFLPGLASGEPPREQSPLTVAPAPPSDRAVQAATPPAPTDPKPNAVPAREAPTGGPQPAAPPPRKVRVSQPLVREVSDYVSFNGHIEA